MDWIKYACTMAVSVFGIPLALAQTVPATWPVRPVSVVIPYAPGANTDGEVRLYTQRLHENLGQAFVMDFKPGAGTTIASAYVAKAPPDGYTLLVVSGAFTVSAAVYTNLRYDPIKDFAPIALMTKRPSVLVAHPSFPANNIAQYLAYAKANPGKINYATAGAGGIQHIAGAWLHSSTNTRITFVHYKGTGEVMPDLLSGRVETGPITLLSALPHLKSGKLKALGLTSTVRNALAPDIATIAEQGVPGFELVSWLGIIAPAATPKPVVGRLGTELGKAAKAPEVVQRIAAAGGDLYGNGPEELGQFITTEITRFRKLVQENNIKLEE